VRCADRFLGPHRIEEYRRDGADPGEKHDTRPACRVRRRNRERRRAKREYDKSERRPAPCACWHAGIAEGEAPDRHHVARLSEDGNGSAILIRSYLAVE